MQPVPIHQMRKSEARSERGLASGTQNLGDPAEGRWGRRKAEADRIHPTFIWGAGRRPPPALASPSSAPSAHQKSGASRSGGGPDAGASLDGGS